MASRRNFQDITSQFKFTNDVPVSFDHTYLINRAKFYASVVFSNMSIEEPESMESVYSSLDNIECLMAYKTDMNPEWLAFKSKFDFLIPNAKTMTQMAYGSVKSRSLLYNLLKEKYQELVRLQKSTNSIGFELVNDYIVPGSNYSSRVIETIIKDVREEEKNAVIMVVGDVGTGKSMISAGICSVYEKEMGQDFDIDKQVAHKTGKSFVDAFDHIQQKFGIGGKARGKSLIWDDAGKGLKSEERFSYIFQSIQDLFQTFRVEGHLVLINCPDEKIITPRMENFFNYIIYTDTIDRKSGFAWAKIFKYKKNRKMQKVDKHFIEWDESKRFYAARPQKVEKIAVKKIPDEMEAIYLEKKIATNQDIVKDLSDTFNLMEQSDAETNIQEVVEEIKENINTFIKEYNNRFFLDKRIIKIRYNGKGGSPRVSLNQAQRIKVIVEESDEFKDAVKELTDKKRSVK